jgi:hypothetical protein
LTGSNLIESHRDEPSPTNNISSLLSINHSYADAMCVRHSSHHVDLVDEGGGQMGKEKLWLVRERAHNLSYISIEDFFHKKKKKKQREF